jgi:hypothetical protein
MRLYPLFVLALLSGCMNTNHPEYHPVTTLHYSQNVSSGVAVSPAQGQPVYVVPAQGAPAYMQAPPPPPPPQPPENFPW